MITRSWEAWDGGKSKEMVVKEYKAWIRQKQIFFKIYFIVGEYSTQYIIHFKVIDKISNVTIKIFEVIVMLIWLFHIIFINICFNLPLSLFLFIS